MYAKQGRRSQIIKALEDLVIAGASIVSYICLIVYCLIFSLRTYVNRGLVDERDEANQNATFRANENKLSDAPRKLKTGDKVTVECDLDLGHLRITVNDGEFEYAYTDSGLRGDPSLFLFGASFGKYLRHNVSALYRHS